MKTEKEIREMLSHIEVDEDFHFVVLKDVGVEEIKTAKDVLRWVLE